MATRDLFVALISGGVVAGLFTFVSIRASQNLSDQQNLHSDSQQAHAEMIENTRFVRDTARQSGTLKPFLGFNLQGAILSGLPLWCDRATAPDSCADLRGANLMSAWLVGTRLAGADATGAVFDDAHLAQVDFNSANLSSTRMTAVDARGANLVSTNLHNADLNQALLNGAYLTSANLIGANLTRTNLWVPICHTRPSPACSCVGFG